MAKDKINEATTVASPRPRVEGYAVVLTWRYPDGAWNTETITDFPEHLGITINEWLQDYKTTEAERNEEEKI